MHAQEPRKRRGCTTPERPGRHGDLQHLLRGGGNPGAMNHSVKLKHTSACIVGNDYHACKTVRCYAVFMNRSLHRQGLRHQGLSAPHSACETGQRPCLKRIALLKGLLRSESNFCIPVALASTFDRPCSRLLLLVVIFHHDLLFVVNACSTTVITAAGQSLTPFKSSGLVVCVRSVILHQRVLACSGPIGLLGFSLTQSFGPMQAQVERLL